MNASFPPYPDYPDQLAYIQDTQVREAFIYLVDQAQRIPGFTARPRPHGYVKRNLHFFDENERSPYAFTVAKDRLLFYLNMPRETHPSITATTLQKKFNGARLHKSGYINFPIRTLADAQAAMHLAFPQAASEVDFWFPNEVPLATSFVEGAVTSVTVNRFERDSHAREACIRQYGYRCVVCNFSFQDLYGSLGENFIHVHHLVEIASIRAEYEVDPIRDLRPVCPNCHAMLHRRSPPLSIEELKQLLTSKHRPIK